MSLPVSQCDVFDNLLLALRREHISLQRHCACLESETLHLKVCLAKEGRIHHSGVEGTDNVDGTPLDIPQEHELSQINEELNKKLCLPLQSPSQDLIPISNKLEFPEKRESQKRKQSSPAHSPSQVNDAGLQQYTTFSKSPQVLLSIPKEHQLPQIQQTPKKNPPLPSHLPCEGSKQHLQHMGTLSTQPISSTEMVSSCSEASFTLKAVPSTAIGESGGSTENQKVPFEDWQQSSKSIDSRMSECTDQCAAQLSSTCLSEQARVAEFANHCAVQPYSESIEACSQSLEQMPRKKTVEFKCCMDEASTGLACSQLVRETVSSEFTRAGSDVFPEDVYGSWERQFKRVDQDSIGILSPEVCYELVCEFISGAHRPSFEEICATLEDITRCSTFRVPSIDGPAVGLDIFNFLKFRSLPKERLHLDRDDPISVLHLAFEREEQRYILQQAVERVEARAVKSQRADVQGWPGVLMEVVPAIVITVNALMIGIQADNDPENMIWSVFELLFLAVYTTEAAVKMTVVGLQVYFRGSERAYNYFDCFCIVVSAVYVLIAWANLSQDANSLMLMKVIRLVRLVRILKVLQYPAFDELRKIVFGLASGMSVLAWALALLGGIVYIFAVTVNLFYDEEEELKTVKSSMFTIFRCFTDGCASYEGAPLQERITQKYGPMFAVGYVLVYTFVVFGLFNLITASYIDNAVNQSFTRKQKEISTSAAHIKEQLEMTFAKLVLNENLHLASTRPTMLQSGIQTVSPKLSLKMKPLPSCENALSQHTLNFEVLSRIPISREVFNMWLEDHELVEFLEHAEIDVANRFYLFDALDVDMGGQLGFDELISGLMRMRGPITKSDITAVRSKIRYAISMIDEIFHKIGCVDSEKHTLT